MTDAQASEHVFWQYRYHRRKWRRLTGKPVRRFRRHVRYFVKRRGKGRGRYQSYGFGHRGRRSFIVTQDDVRAYLNARGKGAGRGSGKGHGRRRNPRGRDGQVMTCRVCNSEEPFAARCPQRKGGGRGASGSSIPNPTFHVSEGRQAEGQSSWNYVRPDDDVDGPLATICQELGTLGDDHTFMAIQAAGNTAGVDPFTVTDPWAARPSARDRRHVSNNPGMSRDTPGAASSSWSSWTPVQAPTPVSLGASSVTTLDTASSGPTPLQPAPVPPTRDDVQSILRAAVEMLMEDRRQRPTGTIADRPVPQLSQLLQGLRGPPTSGPMEVTPATAGLPVMVQPLVRPPAPEASRQAVARNMPPNLSPFMFGTTWQRPVETPAAPLAAASSWENPSMQIARSMALRQTVQAASVPVPPDPQERHHAQTPAGGPAQVVDPVLTPDDGHFPMYDSVLDPVHLGGTNEQLAPLSRGPWRSRSAYLTERHTELDGICTICQAEAHEGDMMCRLICRHMFHYRCWAAAVEAGPSRYQERVATCPNCRGRGHVISCWHYMDTSIATQINPATGIEIPNLLTAPPMPPPQLLHGDLWMYLLISHDHWHRYCILLKGQQRNISRLGLLHQSHMTGDHLVSRLQAQMKQ